MKKTMIALAAVAAVGSASAQVALTGGISFAWIKDIQSRTDGSAAKSLVNSSAYIDIDATEDLGGGVKVAGHMEFNQDGGWASRAYADTKSLMVSTPMATLLLANTRSGGNQAAGLVAPGTGALWEGAFDVGNVISRTGIDTAKLMVPVTSAFTASIAYVEANTATIVPNAYNGAPFGFGYGDGAGTPASTTYTLGATYAVSGLKVVGQYNISSLTEDMKSLLKAANNGVDDPRLTSYDLSVVYDAGVAKLGFSYDSPRRTKLNGTDEAAMLFGVSVPLNAVASLGANYALRDKNNFLQLGAKYDLSKRTDLQAAYGTYTTAGKGLPNGDLVQDTWTVRLSHAF
jgi:predicted porin